jgi:4-amino-4-deoxy-L-arabinose transferase-like glycosyltransferase
MVHNLSLKQIALILFAFSLIAGGGSTLYLSHVAHEYNTPAALEYPAPVTGVAIDNAVIAQNLLTYHTFSQSTSTPTTPDARRTPGYPLFAYASLALFGSFYPLLILQIFTTFLTAGIIFLMARRLLAKEWALAVAVLYILLPDTLLSAGVLYTENFFVLFFTLGLYVFFFSENTSIYSRFALTGFLFAIATYMRPASLYVLLFFIPAYFLFYLPWREITRTHILSAGLLILVFLATLAPWYARNHHEFGVWDFTSLGAYDLFRQNGAQFYQSLSGLGPVESREALETMAGIPLGPIPYDLKYSGVMKKVALEVIFSHPLKYAVFQSTSFIPFFTSAGSHDYWRFVEDMVPSFNPPAEPSLIQALNPFSFRLLVIDINNHGWFLLENVLWGVITLLMLLGLWKSKDVRLARIFFALILYFALVTGPSPTRATASPWSLYYSLAHSPLVQRYGNVGTRRISLFARA